MSEIYTFEGQKYNVHSSRLDDFLQQFPNATKDASTQLEVEAPDGSKTKDMSNWQNMKNNLYNAFEMTMDVGEFYGSDEGAGSALDIATTLIWEGAFGKDKIKKWQQSDFGKWFFTGYAGSDSEDFQKSIKAFEEEQKERRATKTFAEAETIGDYLNVAAGAMVNVGGSVAYNFLTAGTGFFMEFASDNFITANEEKAKSKGVTLEQLVKSGEADTSAPLKIAAAQAGLEYIGFSKILKPLKGTGVSKTYNKAVGKYLTKTYNKNKNIRVGLDILAAGGTEAVTEMGQTGLEIYNKDLAVAKGKGEEINPYRSILSGVLSAEGIEAGLQGFFGGGGLKGTAYSAKALNNIRKSNKDLDVEKDLNRLADLTKRKNSTKDEDLLNVFNSEIDELQSSIKSKIKNGNDIYNNLSDSDIKQIEELSDLSDVTAFRANNLIEKFKQGEIFEDDFKAAIEGLSEKYKQNKQNIQELIYKKNIEFAKQEGEKIGKEVVEIEDISAFQKTYDDVRTEGDFEGDVTNMDGFIKGDQIYINKQTALKEGAISVGSHELLHGIIGKSFDKLNTNDKKKLGKSFISFLNKEQEAAVRKRLKESYNLEGDAIFETEEIFTAFSDAIAKKEITFNENIFQKIGLAIQELMNKLIPGYRKEFKNGRQAYNFLKEYQANIKEGKLGERAIAFAEQDKDIDTAKFKAKASRSQLVDDINDLQQGATTKAEFQTKPIFDPVFKAIKPGGAINNYIRSLKMSSEKTQETIDAVTDRLINFDPAAKRKDGTVIGPRGLGEFIMANVGFGKLVAAKKLAVKAEKTKKTTTIDTKEAKELEDTTLTETTQVDQKDVKLRKLNNFDIELQDGLVDAEIVAEVESLLEQNPTDLQARMEKLILSNIRKKLDNTVGKIAKNKETGNVEATPEYEKFIRREFDEVVSSLGIDVIRKSYKPWFEQTKTGTKDYKNIDPVTGKVSNYRKDTFINKANKIKYIKFFLEGKPNVLRERRTALLRRIARRKAEVAIDNYIETNSSNIDAVVDAKLRTLTRTAKNIQNERVSFDSVKFSNTVKKRVNDYYNTGNFNTKGHALEQVLIDLLKSYNLPTKYLKVAVEYATEEGGIADINLEVLGEALRIEVKLNENVPMGSVLASDYNLKNKILKVAKSSMDKSLPFDQIIDLVRDDIINLVNVYNGKVTAYNNKNNTNEPLMDAENPTGHRMVESIYNEMVNEGVTAKIFQNSLFVSPNAQPLIDHYLNKFAGAVKAIEIFGKGLYSFVENSVLGPNVPYILDMARVETHVRVFNSGRVKQTVKGKRKLVTNKIGDGYIRFQLQFQNSLLKNSLKTPKKPVSLTRKEDMLFGLGIPVKENVATEFDTAVKASRSIRSSKGITVLDFDDTLATTESLVKYTTLDGETGTLNAEEFASTYENLLDKGYTFDFSDFNKVVKGKVAPLFQKALKLQGKFGPENMFVLTARPPQAAKAIFDFLKANGLNIPLKNITGLGNSTSEAKALWIAGKVSEGFNDFYFADDALQNVQAVKNMLDQFDVKSKVQQAKVKFSKSMNNDFNKILEDVTGIDAIKRFSDVKARKRGASKGKFRLFIPPSHEDFVGLLYNFMGKGRKGDQHRDFFEQALVRPLNRAYREIDTAKQAIANDYKQLNKQFADVKKKLRKKTPDGDFTFEDATRVYLWNKHGYDIPGLSPTDQANLVELVMADQELRQYAETLNIISKQEKYVDPGNGWEAGNIKTDLMDATGRVGRAEFFAEFNENADILFSPENLNKIEAAYGKDFRSALEDILHRIKTGVNRPKGQSGTINSLMNYLNGSVGTVMFFNVRSAILQQMSIVNYINFADNNLFAAAKAFANQKQYWKDFAFIFNSDMLKQRRGGIGTDINGADLAQAVEGSKQPTKIVISKLLKLGFLPTQIGDNIAIATGGATFYRNRINKYIKDGLSQKEAETKAFTDFQDLTQSTQQSSRPDMTSKQQASWIGKLVLNFQNITSQYNRIIKKAALDIGKGRISPPYTTKAQSNLGNLSKILYYGGIQNVIFYSLQTALFAVMFDDDQDEDQILKKRERVINGSIDSILRGAGIYGAVASTLKNMIIKFKEQREKGYNKDESAVPMELLNFSPVVGIKIRQLVNAEKTLNYNENVISEMETFDADNPQWSAVTNYTQALTNFPANRLYQKSINMRNALDKDYTNFQRVLFFSGYTTWSLGLGDNEKIIEAKEKSKINKANTRSRDRARTRSGNRIR